MPEDEDELVEVEVADDDVVDAVLEEVELAVEEEDVAEAEVEAVVEDVAEAVVDAAVDEESVEDVEDASVEVAVDVLLVDVAVLVVVLSSRSWICLSSMTTSSTVSSAP